MPDTKDCAFIDKLCAIVGNIPECPVHTPVKAVWSCLYEGDDYGSMIAECHDSSNRVASYLAGVVNAEAEIKALIKEYHKNKQ